MKYRTRRLILFSLGAVVAVALWSGLLLALRPTPGASAEAALEFYFQFGVSHLLLVGLLLLLGRTRAEVNRARRKLDTMGQLARTDLLTGALNRRGFQDHLERELDRSAGRECRLALLIIDLDHFKRVNDRYGHVVGDQTLVEFTKLMGQQVRTTDVVGRWGGEEFVILLRRPERGEALHLADRLQRCVEEHDFPRIGQLTASFGVAELGGNDSLENLFAHADNALYRAKSSGRNRACASRPMWRSLTIPAERSSAPATAPWEVSPADPPDAHTAQGPQQIRHLAFP
jgi:diguanylate cyclase (GGDEF)-like protein